MIRPTTFRRIHSARALTTAVCGSALVLIAVITFYPERPSHAANHKRQQLSFEDRVEAQRDIEAVCCAGPGMRQLGNSGRLRATWGERREVEWRLAGGEVETPQPATSNSRSPQSEAPEVPKVLDAEQGHDQIGAQTPRIIIDSPVCRFVGRTVTFRWRIQGGPATETYRYKVRLDKGVNACDNGIEEEFDAGTNTCLRVELSSSRYLKGTYADFAIQATDSQNRRFCESGRYFVVDPQLPPSPTCAEAAPPVTTTSAASFIGTMFAPESIASLFSVGLARTPQTATSLPLPTTMGGSQIMVSDALGNTRLAPLFFVSPTQINFLIPQGTITGVATVEAGLNGEIVACGLINITNVAPGLFTANANGQGVAAAVALRVKPDGTQMYEPVAEFNQPQNRFIAKPIDLGPDGELVFLVLFGTGFRNRFSLGSVSADIGGTPVQPLFAGAQGGSIGLDQANIGPLPRSLAGRGEMDLVFRADGRVANTARISIR